MIVDRIDSQITITCGDFTVAADTSSGEIRFLHDEKEIARIPVKIGLQVLFKEEQKETAVFENAQTIAGAVILTWKATQMPWTYKTYHLQITDDCVRFYAKVGIDGEPLPLDKILLRTNMSASRYFTPRFDWSEAGVYRDITESDVLSCNQWLSPPPFCYSFETGGKWNTVGIAANDGEHTFTALKYVGGDTPALSLEYEGHTVICSEFETPHFVFVFDHESEYEGVQAYIDRIRGISLKKPIPAWWKRPIFCSWGQMRFDYRADHDGGENGSFINVTDYADEYHMRKYYEYIKAKEIPAGTFVIDMGWAEKGGLAKPCPRKWRDLRGFIDKLHETGMRVLLWFSPLLAEGWPEELCFTLNGRKLSPDPFAGGYRDYLKNIVTEMLSDASGALNADGFKIDFTQCNPTETGEIRCFLDSKWGILNSDRHSYPALSDGRSEMIRSPGGMWGVEVLKGYISSIYREMKQVKPDSMLMTQTANPYFADCVDVLRLNDLDGETPDVPGLMRSRARIAKMCNPNWLIDTDNDLMPDKKAWRDYIGVQPEIGIPDSYYLYGIAASGESLDDGDIGYLREIWMEYEHMRGR